MNTIYFIVFLFYFYLGLFLYFSGMLGGQVLSYIQCDCHELSKLRANNSHLESALSEEREKRMKFEASSNVYAFELEKALKRLSNAEKKLKIVRNSFQFLRAGVSGFSTDLNMAIESFETNS